MNKHSFIGVVSFLVLATNAFAQVYNQGIVFYYNRVFVPGTNYYQVPLHHPDSSLNGILSNAHGTQVPEGVVVYLWSPTNSSFYSSSIFTNGEWTQNFPLYPGIGVMVVAPVAFTNTVVGTLIGHDGNLITNSELYFPDPFAGNPGVYLLGDKLAVPNVGSNLFFNVMGRMPYVGEKITTATSTSTYLGNGDWDLIPNLLTSEAAFFTVLPDPSPLLQISLSGENVVVSWSQWLSGWTLQTNINLSNDTWGDFAGVVENNTVTNQISEKVFFRLKHP